MSSDYRMFIVTKTTSYHSCHNLTYFHYKPLGSPCYCQAAAPGQLLVVLGGGEFGKPRGEEARLDVPLGG